MKKVKINYYKYIVDKSFNSLTLLILLAINVGSIVGLFSSNFFENFISYNSSFIVEFPLLLICIFNTINIVKIFDNNYMFYGRLKTTKDYYNNLIHHVIIANSCIILLNLVISLIILFSLFFRDLSIPPSINGVNYIVICIYYFFKSYIIYILLSILCALVYKKFNRYGSVGYLIIIIILIFNNINTAKIISSIKDMPINFFEYLAPFTSSSIYKYDSILHDVVFFMLYSSGIIIIINIFKILCCKKKKDYLL